MRLGKPFCFYYHHPILARVLLLIAYALARLVPKQVVRGQIYFNKILRQVQDDDSSMTLDSNSR